MSRRELTEHLRGENTAEYRACRALRHAWDPIGAGDRRPEWGTMTCLRCIRCGTLRYDRYSRLTGERIGAPAYVWPDGYRDAEGHDMAWWRQVWAEDIYARGLSADAEPATVTPIKGKRRRRSA